jgi:hypothetical protein
LEDSSKNGDNQRSKNDYELQYSKRSIPVMRKFEV